MAIFHLNMKPLSRGAGRSAVAAAAYRAGVELEDEQSEITHNYRPRFGVVTSQIVLPQSAQEEWAKDRSRLWNMAERAEKRKDARTAREIEVSLPAELSKEQRIALALEFAQQLADRYGIAVDVAIHEPHGEKDMRNHHAHMMLTTRKVGTLGFEAKSELEWENKRLAALTLPNTHEQLRTIRENWEGLSNAHLALAGFENRIDHRSHAARGLPFMPTEHVGVQATHMGERGLPISQVALRPDAAAHNAEVIALSPESILPLITNEKSVFGYEEIARTLHRYIDQPEAFQVAMIKILASPVLVTLQAEQRDASDRVVVPARYSTVEIVQIERVMGKSADRMLAARSYPTASRHVAKAIDARSFLAEEQRLAVAHITGPEQIAVVVGLAGAGKSTMLAAAREAWEAEGYRVQGAALAGKAAEGLEAASGIPSRTLASWSRGWERGFDKLGKRDVFVVDEAGMVGSRQLAQFIVEAQRSGAKIVLVGDPEQLQPIGAGAAFRAVAERVGFVELEGIRRQHQDWQRAASVDFGRHRTAEGLAAYDAHGAVQFLPDVDQARLAIVQDVLADMAKRPQGSRLVLAHRRVDVQALNTAIRHARQAQGELVDEHRYQTTEGERAFAVGDRLLFRENNRELGVKNGVLGIVERVEVDRLEVRLDATAPGEGPGRLVSVSMADYAAVDHGYATTIHKAQGATVDRTYVLASETMDRHLTYVAMTRHREDVQLYAGQTVFRDVAALSKRLSRSQAKETTLDYERPGYAERRGFESEIIVPPDLVPERRVEPAVIRPISPAPRKPSAFDGLQLNTRRVKPSAGQRATFGNVGIAARRPEGLQASLDLPSAVERYARAWTAAQKMRAQDLPLLEHHKTALRDTGAALDAIRSDATRDLLSAIKHVPASAQAMQFMVGREQAVQLVAGIEHEAQVRQDPQLKAVRFVSVWNGLEAERERLKGASHDEARGAVEAQMTTMVRALKNDPSFEALMRTRQQALGIAPGSSLDRVMREGDIHRAVHRGLQLDRGRGFSR